MRAPRHVPGLVLAVALIVPVAADTPPVKGDRIWFVPVPGAIDYQRLFEHPEEGPQARAIISVFKFYQQHTQLPPPLNVGPNSFGAPVRTGAFRTLTSWGIKSALEVESVKDYCCSRTRVGCTPPSTRRSTRCGPSRRRAGT